VRRTTRNVRFGNVVSPRKSEHVDSAAVISINAPSAGLPNSSPKESGAAEGVVGSANADGPAEVFVRCTPPRA